LGGTDAIDGVANAVDGEHVGKADAGTVDAALDGASRATADGCGLVIGEVRGADEDQRFTLLRRKLSQRGAELLEFDPPSFVRGAI